MSDIAVVYVRKVGGGSGVFPTGVIVPFTAGAKIPDGWELAHEVPPKTKQELREMFKNCP